MHYDSVKWGFQYSCLRFFSHQSFVFWLAAYEQLKEKLSLLQFNIYCAPLFWFLSRPVFSCIVSNVLLWLPGHPGAWTIIGLPFGLQHTEMGSYLKFTRVVVQGLLSSCRKNFRFFNAFYWVFFLPVNVHSSYLCAFPSILPVLLMNLPLSLWSMFPSAAGAGWPLF